MPALTRINPQLGGYFLLLRDFPGFDVKLADRKEASNGATDRRGGEETATNLDLAKAPRRYGYARAGMIVIDTGALDYEGIKALSKELGRPCKTLIALAEINEPFYLTPARQRDGEWFAKLWHEHGFGSGSHIRRVHYRLISTAATIVLPDGRAYENTELCWQILSSASRDARYLGIVPAEHFVDRRNRETIVNLDDTKPCDAEIDIEGNEYYSAAELPSLPELVLSRPKIPQRYHIEIVCEKSTIDDILLPIGTDKNINVTCCVGEISETRSRQIVKRAKASGKPCRVLYISDFDPAGLSMPVACARKIEFAMAQERLKLDIQLRPILLTHEQCLHYELPRTPLKESEVRGAGFEARFGEGATELDAMEAIHPGELRLIVETEIDRYHDADLQRRINEVASDIESDIDGINETVHDEFADQISELEDDLAAMEERRKTLWDAIEFSLEEQTPYIGEVVWPEPCEGDEDTDPLFDSTRDYVTQIDRYKAHQGKSTERQEYTRTKATNTAMTPEIAQQIRQMKMAGKSYAQMAKALNVSRTSVHKVLDAAGMVEKKAAA
jgi:hypothetical protein